MEWQLVHEVAVFQVAVPTFAAGVRPLLWHETPLHVSSLPEVGIIWYVVIEIEAEALGATLALSDPLGWRSSNLPSVKWQ